MNVTDIIATIVGSGFITGLLGFFIGRRKEDIEVALKYQEFYKKHIDDLKEEINGLKDKISELVDKDTKKDEFINEQRINLLKWEENCKKMELIIKQKDRQISELIEKEN